MDNNRKNEDRDKEQMETENKSMIYPTVLKVSAIRRLNRFMSVFRWAAHNE